MVTHEQPTSSRPRAVLGIPGRLRQLGAAEMPVGQELWTPACPSQLLPANSEINGTHHAPKLQPVWGPCSTSAQTSLMKSDRHKGRRHIRRNVRRRGQSWRRCGGRHVRARRRSVPKGAILEGPWPWWTTCAEVGHPRRIVAMDNPYWSGTLGSTEERRKPSMEKQRQTVTHSTPTPCTTRRLTGWVGRDCVWRVAKAGVKLRTVEGRCLD